MSRKVSRDENGSVIKLWFVNRQRQSTSSYPTTSGKCGPMIHRLSALALIVMPRLHLHAASSREASERYLIVGAEDFGSA
jgi:hypothetical protein